jgi:hypothetical protein
MYAVRTKVGRAIRRFATRGEAQNFVRRSSSKSPYRLSGERDKIYEPFTFEIQMRSEAQAKMLYPELKALGYQVARIKNRVYTDAPENVWGYFAELIRGIKPTLWDDFKSHMLQRPLK